MGKREALKRKKELEVFIGGLPYDANEDELLRYFDKY